MTKFCKVAKQKLGPKKKREQSIYGMRQSQAKVQHEKKTKITEKI